MWLIYLGTEWILKTSAGLVNYAYLSPTLPLGLILLTLFVMLIISNTATVTGSFYLSDDLDLFVASPIPGFRFFLQRLLLVGMSTSIVPFFFILPIIICYGSWFDQGIWFYICAVLALIPYFLIPLGFAFLFSSCLVFFVPVRRARLLYLLVLMMLLGCIYLAIDLVSLVLRAQGDTQGLVQIVKVLSSAYIPWLPSSWVGEVIGELLFPQGRSLELRLLLLWGATLVSFSAAFLLYQFAYLSALTTMKNNKSTGEEKSTLFKLRKHISPIFKQRAGFWIKDAVTLSRDMSQLFQGLLLFGIYSIYIYNLRVFAGFYTLGAVEELWWTNFLFISNFCISAFISSALCTRFVFPTISLEGRVFPLIKKAPLTMRTYVLGKFLFWYFVVAAVHSFVVGTGAYAAGAKPIALAINVLSSWILCYGLTGLAIGMGSYFARFDWEHTAQLAVGFGNIIFMLCATGFILANMIPVWLLLFATPISLQNSSGKFLFYLLIAMLFCALNFVTTRAAIRFGVRRLEELEV